MMNMQEALPAPAVVAVKERRTHQRLATSELPGLRAARLKYGQEVNVIDLSSGGMLFELTGDLRSDSTIVLEFSGAARTLLVPSRVLRCRKLGTVDNMPRLEGACVFRRPLGLEEFVNGAPLVEPPGPRVAVATDVPGETAVPAGWQHVTLRYRDGRLVRGYTNDFSQARNYLHVSPAPHAADPRFVSMIDFDALFFLADRRTDMVDEPQPAEPPAPAACGRRMAVTAPDGKELVGSTLTYSRQGSGFFIRPIDPTTGTARVFITQNGIRSVRFL